MKRLLLGFTILTAVPSAATASTIYNFSFTGDNSPFFGAAKLIGTVTGQIALPDGDGTFAPLSVTILTYPAGLQGTVDANLIPTTWAGQSNPSQFIVSGGAITGAAWAAQTGGAPGTDQLRLNFAGINAFSLDVNAGGWNAVSNAAGFAGVTYSRATAADPVPEPASLMLLGVGLVALVRGVRVKRAR